MCILDIQNLQLSDNNFDISINDLNLEGDVSYIETSINHYFKSYKVLQQATHNLNLWTEQVIYMKLFEHR